MSHLEWRNPLPSPFQPAAFRAFLESEYQVAVAQLARYDEKIAKEYTLITDRMNWLVVSEAFVFTVFAGSVATYQNAGPTMWPVMKLIIGIMPLLGIFICGVIMRAIAAAEMAVVRLKQRREDFEKRLPVELRIDQISHNDIEHRRGNAPTQLAPWGIIVIWVVLLGFAIFSLSK
jgi:hypothetical protein